MTALAAPPVHPRRLVYLGSPDVAVAPLRALAGAGFDVVLVVSGPDRRRGRRAEPSPTPVKAAAAELGIAVTTSLDEAVDAGAELGVVVAFGQIIPTALLERLPMINIHFSLLPRWRGAAPVERAILAGDVETGVCVMQLAPELDTGDVYRMTAVQIDAAATAASLRAELTAAGSRLLVEALTAGLDQPRRQVGEVSYAHKIRVADLELDFSAPAVELARLVRVGGAWTTFRGERFKIWETEAVEGSGGVPGSIGDDLGVATGSGSLRLLVVQPAGKSRVSATEWVNGARISVGEGFDS